MRHFITIALIATLACTGIARAEEPARVFAAASLTTALNDIAAKWQAQGHAKPTLAYGGSSALAKQIEAGAPADLFASADNTWMDYVATRDLIDKTTRAELLGNTLVLIVPKGKPFAVKLEKGFDFAHAFDGRLCTGEPGVVPVGIYAKDALQALGWWDAIQARIVGTEDVRTALTFVERGECAAGIVYATDARISTQVEVLATFPADTHKPIVYPFALIKNARPEAKAFLDYLETSPEARASFEQQGFSIISH